jgi:hypothetical protein
MKKLEAFNLLALCALIEAWPGAAWPVNRGHEDGRQVDGVEDEREHEGRFKRQKREHMPSKRPHTGVKSLVELSTMKFVDHAAAGDDVLDIDLLSAPLELRGFRDTLRQVLISKSHLLKDSKSAAVLLGSILAGETTIDLATFGLLPEETIRAILLNP